MFTTFLKDEEKACLLELAHAAMNADGRADAVELQIIENLEEECGLEGFVPNGDKIESSISGMSGASGEAKRALLVELIGVALSDDDFCDAEKAFMEKLFVAWGISSETSLSIVKWVKSFNEHLVTGCKIIEEGA